MAELPTGTLTFLLTDVEGSTALWEEAPEAMRVALSRHDELFEVAVHESGGTHIRPRGEGDSRFAVFDAATQAASAVLAIQRAFAAEPWLTPRPIKVRVGLHTGEAQLRDHDYYGVAVNRCARIRGIGHGGQTLLSEATAALVREDLPEDASLVDLGEHRLKDLARPEHIYQLAVPDLPDSFLPLSSLDAHRHNLPIQPTSLIGREREVAAALKRLSQPQTRLLTLTGPGGTGKTRLAHQIAAELLDQLADGVAFVALAPISDPELVTSAIAQALGVREVAGQTLLESVKQYLQDRQLLLVLDNFEQVLPAALVVAELLAGAPKLKVLVTSRATLHLSTEQEFAVPALALPNVRRLRRLGSVDSTEVTTAAAVRLFTERARAVWPDFVTVGVNALAVAEICVRLDGLPLAIELAAARIKVLSPKTLLTRLERRLPLLTGGSRDLPVRQQTLRDAIAWSYELLDPAEQAIFRRLSVFVGGCTLAAAERVCNLDGDLVIDVLDGLASLMDKSLVRREEYQDDEPRFGMLETIREFGLEQLAALGEAESVARQHAELFAALVEEAGPSLHSGGRDAWLPRLTAEQDNLRAAMRWSLDHQASEVGLRIIAPLWLWYWREGVAEGRRWAEELLAAPGADRPTAARAWALFVAAALAFAQGDVGTVRQRCAESAAIAGTVADQRLQALAWAGLGSVMMDDPPAARARIQEALALSRAAGDAWGLAFVSLLGGMLEVALGSAQAARPLLEAAAAGFQAVGDEWIRAIPLLYLGFAALQEGDDERARAKLQESLAAFRANQDKKNASLVLASLGGIVRRQGELAETAALFMEGLTLCHDIGDRPGAATCMEGLADLAQLQAQPGRAARLLSAAQALKETSIPSAASMSEEAYRRGFEALGAEVGEELFRTEWMRGRAISLEEALAEGHQVITDATQGNLRCFRSWAS